MKLFYILFIQVVFFTSVSAQNMIRSYSETEQIIHRSDFRYDAQGRVVEEVLSSQNKDFGEYVFRSKTEREYENDQLKSTKTYQYLDDEWFLKTEFRIFYNDAGCVDRQEQTFNIRPGESREHIITMVNEYDCADPWRNEKDHLFLSDSPFETIITRRRTDSSEIEIYNEFHENTGTWVNKGSFERKYNPQNNITELINSTLFFNYARKYVSVYDNSGENIMSYETFFKSEPASEWELLTTEEFVYEGSQVKKINTKNSASIIFEDAFEYYCDGLLKRKTRTRPNENESIKIETYEYDQEVDGLEDCEQLENLDLFLYPNPAKDWIYVRSDIFQKGPSEVFIRDALGRLIHNQKVQDRVPNVWIKLNQNLNVKQMLVISLVSEGGLHVSQKFMIE